jgi:hypothetical protein
MMLATVVAGPVMDAFQAGMSVGVWVAIGWITCAVGATLFRRILGV